MNDHVAALVQRRGELAALSGEIERAGQLVIDCYRAGGKLLLCGNGGSAADSEHLVGELMKGYLRRRPIPAAERAALLTEDGQHGAYLADHLQGALPAISLVSHSALISAIANDVAADMVFAQQVYGYGAPGDVLVCISTSGTSVNVLHAARVARARRLGVLGFTGEYGGALKPLCDACVAVPGSLTAEIQERHLAIYHALCAWIEAEFFQS
jgi:D-sedoheptulose 7-phosphate isomerase